MPTGIYKRTKPPWNKGHQLRIRKIRGSDDTANKLFIQDDNLVPERKLLVLGITDSTGNSVVTLNRRKVRLLRDDLSNWLRK